MDMLTQPFDDDMKAELETLRQSIRRIAIDAPTLGLPRPTTLVAQADRILQRLAHWLLDDEQKQAVCDHPWQAFFLHAAACLCDIGLMDGSGLSADSSVARRSHDWIQGNWQALGIKDARRAGIMALICLQMQDVSDLDPASVGSVPTHYAGTLINTKWTSVFQDGIFVTQDDLLLPEGARQHVVGRINLKGRDKCELSMDRNRIFWTGERKKQIRQQIRLALVDIANRLMNALDTQGASVNTRNSFINQLAIFFDFSEVDDVVYDGLCPSLRKVVDKRFRDFVRIHFPHARSVGRILEADGYNQQWQQRILAAFASTH